MKKSARVSEKLVNPGLPGLQVATRLNIYSNSSFFRDPDKRYIAALTTTTNFRFTPTTCIREVKHEAKYVAQT